MSRYFHREFLANPEEEENRLDIFHSSGYDCMEIWEKGLRKAKHEDLIARIKDFNEFDPAMSQNPLGWVKNFGQTVVIE